ncbi:MAG: hypothetical protein GY827_09875 [Cytophagales bacterium]|nr:hypothetical protein [Cytophagales bacterium]
MKRINLFSCLIIIAVLFGCGCKQQKNVATTNEKEKKDTLQQVVKNQNTSVETVSASISSTEETPTVVEESQENTQISSFQKVLDKNVPTVEKFYTIKQKLKGSKIDPKKATAEAKELRKQKAFVFSTLEEIYIKRIKLEQKQLAEIQSKNVNPKYQKEINILLKKEAFAINKLSEIENKLEIVSAFDDLETVRFSFNKSIKAIQKSAKTQTGEFQFVYNNESYTAVIVDLEKHDINLHWLSPAKRPYGNLTAVHNLLKKQQKEIVMITNGGMFHPNQFPVGLFVSNGKQFSKIDATGNKADNFHMLPNGVFYTDSTGAHVLETGTFIKGYKSKKIQPIVATQSGPMLVIDGEHHHRFNHGSRSRKLRSGVGILPNGKIIFIISDEHNTNFFQFSTIFKDVFACQNALFLDGAISKMYTPKLSPKLGGHFGPMISVTKK